MADTNTHILKQLQGIELMPPAGAFDKAWGKILLQNEALGNPEITEKKAFEKLQEYSMQAPELDFKALLAGEKKEGRKKVAVVISKNWMKVAAALAIAITGVVMYTTMPNKNNGQATSNQLAVGMDESKSETQDSITGKQTDNITAGSLNDKHFAKEAAQRNHSSINAEAAKKSKKGPKINYGKAEDFFNNDMFFTLVNYQEYGKEKLFTKTIKNKKITLNHYSYINLSDNMVAMLQEVYLTKKNGKPSRKAKKAKKKFEKWRKKDENYFDKNLDKNPTDIIDLSQFIMKN